MEPRFEHLTHKGPEIWGRQVAHAGKMQVFPINLIGKTAVFF
jgi:hypothetical protein